MKGVIRRWNGVSKISFVAHSLGGLVSRYAIGRLYECTATTESTDIPVYGPNGETSISTTNLNRFHRSSIGGLEPMNFITFATPHLGSRGHKQVSIYDLIVPLNMYMLLLCTVDQGISYSLVFTIHN